MGYRLFTHEFDSGYTGMSTACNALVMRHGAADECGLPRNHVLHAAHGRALSPDEREVLRIKFQQSGVDAAILFVERLMESQRVQALQGFVDHVATQAAYNGAGDPGQKFYDEGLNPWLKEIMYRFLTRTDD